MLALLFSLAAAAATAPAPSPVPHIVPDRLVIETDLGPITIEVYRSQAPRTVDNFLSYVQHGLYDDGRFHRTVREGNQPDRRVRIDVVQAGRTPGGARPDLPPVVLERTRDTHLRHLDGTVSMARDGPDTATSDFFICVGDQPELDFGGARNPDGQGFAAFGKVVSGMDVVRRIHAAPADGQSLTPPVRIRTIRRVR